MPSILDQAQDVAREAARFAGCTLDAAYSFGSRILTGNDPASLFPALCPDGIPGPELFPVPPFEGGQCEGVVYLVSYQYEEMATFLSEPRTVVPPQSPIPALGPISGLIGVNPRTINGFEGFASLQIIAGNGQFPINAFASNSNVLSWQITGVEREDGLPDECGDPPLPPRPNPPLPIPPPEDRPVTDPDGGPDINFTFAPTFAPIFVDVDGRLNIPVNVEVNGPNFNVPINIPVNISLPDFEPTINIGGGNGEPGPPTTPCCDPPNVPGEETEGEEDEPVATEPTPPGAVMYGVLVRSVVNVGRAQATEINTGETVPSLWVPRLGSVYFELVVQDEEGNDRVTFSQDVDVKLTDQLVLAPSGVAVRRAFVRPSLGVSSAAVPLFKQGR